MTNNQKQKSLPYGQCLSTIFKPFDIELTYTDRTLYFKHLEIDHQTLTKMKLVWNDEGVWALKDQVEAHDEEEEEHFSSDGEFVNVFATPPTTFSFEDVGTSF
jgi:hypothetical protein